VIAWKRSTGDYVESHCGRWWITPIYGGCTRPESYELRLDNRVVGSGANQGECKEDAERYETDVGIEVKPRPPIVRPCLNCEQQVTLSYDKCRGCYRAICLCSAHCTAGHGAA
jgi:hypothetical protein